MSSEKQGMGGKTLELTLQIMILRKKRMKSIKIGGRLPPCLLGFYGPVKEYNLLQIYNSFEKNIYQTLKEVSSQLMKFVDRLNFRPLRFCRWQAIVYSYTKKTYYSQDYTTKSWLEYGLHSKSVGKIQTTLLF